MVSSPPSTQHRFNICDLLSITHCTTLYERMGFFKPVDKFRVYLVRRGYFDLVVIAVFRNLLAFSDALILQRPVHPQIEVEKALAWVNTCKAQCLDEMDRCFLRLFLKRPKRPQGFKQPMVDSKNDCILTGKKSVSCLCCVSHHELPQRATTNPMISPPIEPSPRIGA